MSLINEALKKAQRMRADKGQSQEDAFSGHGDRPLRQGPSARLVIGLVSGATVLVCLSVFGTVYFLRKPVSSISFKSEERALKAEDAPPIAKLAEPAPNPAPASKSAAELKPVPPAEDGSPNLYLPPAVAAAVKPSDTPPPAPQASPESKTQLAADKSPAEPKLKIPSITPEAKPVVAAAPKTDSKPHPEYQQIVDKFRIIGIRAAKGEGKVLMNDRVYRLNDLVDASSGLRLVEVSNERLVFEDPQGRRYYRNF